MRVTRYGHSCLLVEGGAARVLIDPGNLSEDDAFDVRELDAIAITHQHPDHVDRDRIALLLLRNMPAARLCDPDTATLVTGWATHTDGDEASFGDLALTGIGSRHAEILPEIPRITNTGYLARADGITLFHPGDAYEYAPADVDVLAVPLLAPWARGIAATVDFVRRVAPAVVFPIHDGVASDAGRQLYWQHVAQRAGVPEVRFLGPTDSADFR
jgi:L-ascorbate metabolism protein UlaG (beta-lactamase superfamily)